MILLGIDPGTAKLGYGVLNVPDIGKETKGYKKYPKLLDCDVIITKPDKDMPERLKLIYDNLKRISKEFKPDIMIIEKVFFNTNAKTAISVGQAQGVAMLVAAEGKMRVYQYTALQAKKVLTGYGRSDKSEMKDAVQEALGLDIRLKSPDANDAVAIGLCFLHKDYENHITGKGK